MVNAKLFLLLALIGVQNEADALQNPVAYMLGCAQIGLEHQTNSHGVSTHGSCVNRCFEGVLELQPKRFYWNNA